MKSELRGHSGIAEKPRDDSAELYKLASEYVKNHEKPKFSKRMHIRDEDSPKKDYLMSKIDLTHPYEPEKIQIKEATGGGGRVGARTASHGSTLI